MDWGWSVFDGVIEAARAALDDVEYDDLPPALRRVQSSSARRLPPPLRNALGRAVDAEVWLRTAAQDHLEETDEVGGLVLTRQPGWEEAVSERMETIHSEQTRSERVRTAARTSDRVRALEREVERLRATIDQLRSRPQAPDPEVVERMRLANHRLRAELDLKTSEADRARDERDRLQGQLDEADAVIERLRRRPPSTGRVEEGNAIVLGRGDPIGLARTLDAIVDGLARSRTDRPEPELDAAVPPLGSLRPDRREALDALARQSVPFTLAVDGWNVAYLLEAAPDATTRHRVETAAARYRRLAEAPVHVIVLWDTSFEPAAPARRSGIEVRFVESADAAIVELARQERGRLVAVSSDRDVRERSEQHGAVAVWSSALVEWMS